jgi:hypothetical protein
VGAADEVADRTLQGLPDDHRPGLGVVGQRVQPLLDLGDVTGRQEAVAVHRAFGDREERGVLETAAGEHPREVPGDRLDRIGRRSVEDDRDRG